MAGTKLEDDEHHDEAGHDDDDAAADPEGGHHLLQKSRNQNLTPRNRRHEHNGNPNRTVGDRHRCCGKHRRDDSRSDHYDNDSSSRSNGILSFSRRSRQRVHDPASDDNDEDTDMNNNDDVSSRHVRGQHIAMYGHINTLVLGNHNGTRVKTPVNVAKAAGEAQGKQGEEEEAAAKKTKPKDEEEAMAAAEEEEEEKTTTTKKDQQAAVAKQQPRQEATAKRLKMKQQQKEEEEDVVATTDKKDEEATTAAVAAAAAMKGEDEAAKQQQETASHRKIKHQQGGKTVADDRCHRTGETENISLFHSAPRNSTRTSTNVSHIRSVGTVATTVGNKIAPIPHGTALELNSRDSSSSNNNSYINTGRIATVRKDRHGRVTPRTVTTASTTWEITPIPIFILILTYLDQQGLMKASTVSKQWHQIIHTNPGMAQHRIIPVLELRASHNKSDDGRTIRLMDWFVANLNKLQRYRVLQLLDVNKFNDAAIEDIEDWFWDRFPRFQLNGIVSLDISSPMKLSNVDHRVLYHLSYRLPNLREINLSNIGFEYNLLLNSIVTHCYQLEKITWNNMDKEGDNIHMTGFDMKEATNLREIIMDGSFFNTHRIHLAPGDGGIDEISDLENHPRFFLFYRLKSQVLERLSIRRAKFLTNNQLVPHVPQDALIKYIRNAPRSLRWFRSDLSKDNIEMLRLERPGIEFLN